MTTAQLVVMLTQATRRLVVDESGLTGEFDVDITFMPDQPVQLNGGAAPPSLAMAVSFHLFGSPFTILQPRVIGRH